MNYNKSQAGMLIIKVKRTQSRAPWAGGSGKVGLAAALEAGFGQGSSEKGREHEEHLVQVSVSISAWQGWRGHRCG